MTDDPKDTTNPNQTPKREVKVTELVANDGILKGKKTDVQTLSCGSFQ